LTYDANVHLRQDKGTLCPQEFYKFTNPVSVCAFPHLVAKGTIMVFWDLPLFPAILQFGLDPSNQLMLEIFDHPDTDIVQKFCDIIQSTNIKIKLTP